LPQRVSEPGLLQYHERDADVELIAAIPLAMSDPTDVENNPPSIEECLADYADCSD
jgi:hypothetical protein